MSSLSGTTLPDEFHGASSHRPRRRIGRARCGAHRMCHSLEREDLAGIEAHEVAQVVRAAVVTVHQPVRMDVGELPVYPASWLTPLANALFGPAASAQRSKVREILGKGPAPNLALQPPGPGVSEIGDAADAGQDVDAVGRKPELKYGIRFFEVRWPEIEGLEWRAKRRERPPHPDRILARSVDPDVECAPTTRNRTSASVRLVSRSSQSSAMAG